MLKGYSRNGMSKLALGTHLGDFSKEVSEQYVKAVSYALQNGISTIDGAINYRGMCSEKDEGIAIQNLIKEGKIKREDFCITSKAGLLFGDVEEGMNPKKYLDGILKPLGISENDFCEYQGLYQTLNPRFFEVALSKSLQNLGLETIDIHFIHIPEITRSTLSEEEFYDRMEALFEWYETKISKGKIRNYGIALEFMCEEPFEEKWHFEMEKLKERAEKVAKGDSHFKYVLFEYNLLCPYATSEKTQTVNGQNMTLADACRELNLRTVASMPFAMGDGFENYTKEELLRFALAGTDHVIFGSKNVEHIREIMEVVCKIACSGFHKVKRRFVGMNISNEFIKRGYPDKETAEALLKDAEACNPGPWGNHSRIAAHCAEKIAAACGLDSEKAYVLGLLHDIGRKFGVRHLGHVSDGFSYMTKLGLYSVAQICLTHSFNNKTTDQYIGNFDTTEEELELINSSLEKVTFDDYDKLIQLCDALAGSECVLDIEERMADVKKRYGQYPQEKWDSNIQLKEYFESRAGKSIYEVVEKENFQL